MTKTNSNQVTRKLAKKIVAERDEARAKVAALNAKLKAACGGSEPSGSHDWADELAGLLRVTRSQRDGAERELAEARAERDEARADLADVKRAMEEIHPGPMPDWPESRPWAKAVRWLCGEGWARAEAAEAERDRLKADNAELETALKGAQEAHDATNDTLNAAFEERDRLREALRDARLEFQLVQSEIQSEAERELKLCLSDLANVGHDHRRLRFLQSALRRLDAALPAMFAGGAGAVPPRTCESCDMAWAIIANAGGGSWAREAKDWQEAAAKWRNRYHGRAPGEPAALAGPAPAPTPTHRWTVAEGGSRRMRVPPGERWCLECGFSESTAPPACPRSDYAPAAPSPPPISKAEVEAALANGAPHARASMATLNGREDKLCGRCGFLLQDCRCRPPEGAEPETAPPPSGDPDLPSAKSAVPTPAADASGAGSERLADGVVGGGAAPNPPTPPPASAGDKPGPGEAPLASEPSADTVRPRAGGASPSGPEPGAPCSACETERNLSRPLTIYAVDALLHTCGRAAVPEEPRAVMLPKDSPCPSCMRSKASHGHDDPIMGLEIVHAADCYFAGRQGFAYETAPAPAAAPKVEDPPDKSWGPGGRWWFEALTDSQKWDEYAGLHAMHREEMRQLRIAAERLAALEEVAAALPKCSGKWSGGSGGHRQHNPRCGRTATYYRTDDIWAYCDEHISEVDRDRICGYEDAPWADAVRALARLKETQP